MILYTAKHKIPFLIDDDDFETVSQYTWHLHEGYPTTNIRRPGPKKTLTTFLHLFLLGRAPLGLEWDHVNRLKWDNRRENLRLATHAENQWNTGLRCTNTSGAAGVTWNDVERRWRARIHINSKRINLGRFCSFEEAAAARLIAEQEHR